MSKKKYMGTLYSVNTVLYKIEEIMSQGYPMENIYAVTSDQDLYHMLRGSTGIEIHNVNGDDWKEKLQQFVDGDEPMSDAVERTGFSLQMAKTNFNEVNDGGVMLLVDPVFGNRKDKSTEMESGAELSTGGALFARPDNNEHLFADNSASSQVDTENL